MMLEVKSEIDKVSHILFTLQWGVHVLKNESQTLSISPITSLVSTQQKYSQNHSL